MATESKPARVELPRLDRSAAGRTKRKSGRWERPLKGELGGLGTHVFVATGARLVPLSGTRSSRLAATAGVGRLRRRNHSRSTRRDRGAVSAGVSRMGREGFEPSTLGLPACPQHGVRVDAENGREVLGGRKALSRFCLALGDRSPDFTRDLLVEIGRILPVHLDIEHSASHSSATVTSVRA